MAKYGADKAAHHGKRLSVWNRTGGRCWLCGSPVEFALYTIDHVLPLSHGGPARDLRNLLPAHRVCNERRANRHPLPHELLHLSKRTQKSLRRFLAARGVPGFWAGAQLPLRVPET